MFTYGLVDRVGLIVPYQVLEVLRIVALADAVATTALEAIERDGTLAKGWERSLRCLAIHTHLHGKLVVQDQLSGISIEQAQHHNSLCYPSVPSFNLSLKL